jgi:hypothetical protein
MVRVTPGHKYLMRNGDTVCISASGPTDEVKVVGIPVVKNVQLSWTGTGKYTGAAQDLGVPGGTPISHPYDIIQQLTF